MEKQENTLRKVLEIISKALGMHTWFPLILVISLLKTGLTSQQIKILFPSLLLFEILIPISYIFFAQKVGKVSEWDLPKREERHIFLFVVFFCSLVSLVIVYMFGNKLLFSLSVIGIILTVIILAITRFWKISLHTSLNTAATIVVNFLFGWQLPFLYLLIPLVVWARYSLGRHGMKELLAGVVISAILILGAFKYLGYI